MLSWSDSDMQRAVACALNDVTKPFNCTGKLFARVHALWAALRSSCMSTCFTGFQLVGHTAACMKQRRVKSPSQFQDLPHFHTMASNHMMNVYCQRKPVNSLVGSNGGATRMPLLMRLQS